MGNYIRIDKDNMVNGPGVRAVFWFAGCSHRCKYCHNSETWNWNQGERITGNTLSKLFDELRKDYVQGVTFTGGDPLFEKNREDLLFMVSGIKDAYPDKDIWVWTGFKWEDVKDLLLMNYIDVLVDGEFDYAQRELDLQQPGSAELLKYRGSSNQRVIDVQASLKAGEIVPYVD